MKRLSNPYRRVPRKRPVARAPEARLRMPWTRADHAKAQAEQRPLIALMVNTKYSDPGGGGTVSFVGVSAGPDEVRQIVELIMSFVKSDAKPPG